MQLEMGSGSEEEGLGQRSMSLAADRYTGQEETEMFHGTDSRSAQLIVRGQHFRPSAGGLLGAGVYVTRSRRKAEGYRVHHPNAGAVGRHGMNALLPDGSPDPGCVLKFRVRLGACKLMSRDTPREAFTTWHDDTVPDPTPRMRAAAVAAGKTYLSAAGGQGETRESRIRWNSARSEGCPCCPTHGRDCPGHPDKGHNNQLGEQPCLGRCEAGWRHCPLANSANEETCVYNPGRIVQIEIIDGPWLGPGDQQSAGRQFWAMHAGGRAAAVAAFLAAVPDPTRPSVAKLQSMIGQDGRLDLANQVTDAGPAAGLAQLPAEIEHLIGLRELILVGNVELRELPNSLCKLTTLEKLEVGYCGLCSLPDQLGELVNLKDLGLSGQSSMQGLPTVVCELTALETLNVDSSGLGSLPDQIGSLASLKTLVLDNNKELHELPDSLCQLITLENLSVSGCGLGLLPDQLGELANLKVLILGGNPELHKLPESLCQLVMLGMLQANGCGLGSLPDQIGSMASLNVLILGGNKELQKLPDSLCQLVTLLALDVSGSGLGSLPDQLGELANLQALALEGCLELRALPASLGRLQTLTTLDISLCPGLFGQSSMQGLPAVVCELTALETLAVQSCGLGSLPDQIGSLANLKTLLLVNNKELRALPASLGRLQTLTTLDISGCPGLATLQQLKEQGGVAAVQDYLRSRGKSTKPLRCCLCAGRPR
jgi:Leucine-rich repeat (LRR) protein